MGVIYSCCNVRKIIPKPRFQVTADMFESVNQKIRVHPYLDVGEYLAAEYLQFIT